MSVLRWLWIYFIVESFFLLYLEQTAKFQTFICISDRCFPHVKPTFTYFNKQTCLSAQRFYLTRKHKYWRHSPFSSGLFTFFSYYYRYGAWNSWLKACKHPIIHSEHDEQNTNSAAYILQPTDEHVTRRALISRWGYDVLYQTSCIRHGRKDKIKTYNKTTF